MRRFRARMSATDARGQHHRYSMPHWMLAMLHLIVHFRGPASMPPWRGRRSYLRPCRVDKGPLHATGKRQRQFAVASGAMGQFEREARAPVWWPICASPGNRPLVQNIGDPLVDFEVLRNGEQMVLSGILDQIGIAELLRVHQHPLSDCDRV